MNRPKLSLCMIVRDNAETIGPCLSGIRDWVDEMNVVDTGSRDNTPEIARRLGAKVSFFPWQDSFSAARNESLRLATGEWIFWMDSDDVIDERNARGVRELANSAHPPQIMGYVVQVHCPDARSDGDTTVVDHVKLFRNHPAIRFEHRIHEQVLMPIRRIGGEISWTDLFVVHANSDQTSEGRQRKYERDLRLLQLDAQDFPDHPFVLFNFGMTYNDMGKHEEAISWLERSINVSNGVESHLRKAYALLVHSLSEVGRTDDALAACHYALGLFPKDAELHFRQGMLFHHWNRFADAIQSYRTVLCNGDDRYLTSRCESITGYKARHNLAMVYGDAGAHALAELQWRTIIDEKPRYRAAWKSLGQALLKQGKRSAAGVVAETMSVERSLRADGLLLQAELLMKGENKPQAVDLLDELSKKFPDDADVAHHRCRILFEAGLWDEAHHALSELTDHQPSDGSAWHNLGLVALHLNNLADAAAAFQRSLDVRPESPETRHLFQDASTALRHSAFVKGDRDDAMQILPPCHSRRDHDKQSNIFFCAHPNVHAAGNLVTPSVCRTCTRWQDPPPANFRPHSTIVRNGPCANLGQQLGLRDCPSCRGDVKVKVYACSHPAHDSTTITDCHQCQDYQLKSSTGGQPAASSDVVEPLRENEHEEIDSTTEKSV